MRLYGTMQIDEKGILNIGGVKTTELAEEYGSPLIVIDEKEIENNINQYQKGFEDYPGRSRIIYASKAFANRTLYRILNRNGLSLDVVSGGELYTALEAGFPTEKIYFHGNNKLPSEIEMALENSIGRFFIDNIQEARLLNKIAKQKNEKVKALIRLTPGIEAHTHEFIMTGQIDSKFGVSIENGDAMELVSVIEELDNIELTGIHAHIGSQIYERVAYIKLIEIMIKFMTEIREQKGYVLTQLDLGGGLGIPQTEDDPDLPIEDFINDLVEKIIEECKKKSFPLPELAVEPGRSIVGTAGTTLYTVGMIKEIDNIKKYITIDGGMTDNIRPALYGADYDGFLANRCQKEEVETVTIAGKCCESGDILIEDLKLPVAKTGDLLAVPCTGAYSYALSSNYNSIPRPAVVLVKDGRSNIIIKRESYKEIISNDIIPEGY